jgi:gliding motility-associated-like protein
VTVTDFTGCSVTENYTVNLLGNIPITATPTISIEQPGTEVQLNASGGVGYSWDPPINLDDPNISNPTATILFDTMYVVTGIDGAGCFGTDTVWVYLAEPCGDLFVPTIFSPNGDGLNENLCIIGNCVGTIDYKVFNRWGQLVFSTTDQAICWDGTFKGKPVLEGVYAYTFSGTLPDGTEVVEKGSLTVVR